MALSSADYCIERDQAIICREYAVQVFAKNVFNAEKANAIDEYGYVTVDIDQSMIGTIFGNIRLGDTGFSASSTPPATTCS